jgi:hypothetical protein
MEKAHLSLDRRANLTLIVLWGLGAAAIVTVSNPRPLLAIGIAAGCGFGAGLLQRASIRGNPTQFAQAKSAVEVRRAFMLNRPGQLSIVIMWATAAVLGPIGFTGAASPVAVGAGGYLAFMFVRDLAAFGAIRDLEKAAPGSQRAF